jgi:effector-binding domain-containing protein
MEQQDPVIIDAPELTLAVVRATVAMDELTDFYDRSFTELGAVLARQGLAPTGPAVGVYFGSPGATAEVAAGFPVARPVDPEGNVTSLVLPAGRVAQLVHEGAYDGLGASYDRLFGWIGTQDEVPGEVMWETYLTEPTPDKDPAAMRTLISWAIERD